MTKPSLDLTPADAATELRTVRDLIRYGVSRFNEADLDYGHGTTNAHDEAVFMVLEGLSLPIDQLDPYVDARLTLAERRKVADLLHARVETRKPASYLLNKAYIQGIPFYVDERVIVPRSYIGEILFSDLIGGDDFTLVEDPTEVERVLDLCTGSGCLAILAAQIFPEAQVDAVDLSADALEVAKRNVADSGFEDRITLHHGDLFAPLKNRKYDVIITNPPYVDAEAMAALPPEFRHEPQMALASGEDGLDIVRRILKEAPKHLTPEGGLLCEFGTGREILEAEYPDLDFFWVETANSFGEVFWLTRDQLKPGK
ncbi:50S ribosomal protein L3 N(5)-glutamine methyltransferase [Azospirillum brasilense]|uniref:Ribosomal protein uL3 glutamine methyltransferase n=1 Tax=Azospirillum brasilense TaxID=192 RepID=A0A0P0ETL9_AZOBR|nr:MULTISPECIES: 50S ribosomal protein L3 N(5)-glutamine methyltransferase [Azospirillum]ALJ35702.1 protein-(glutamine-N5) methyltransferase, ribosomal protein L3-specific [Azospirillum brasilense]MDW7554968.1 50S ribosomal protein L3 N(5)-glutamine methyltransferase [Azospirillum brasilense]MDW7594745.1 50S ribosomal protein L3 N(5)-glutamine methyltransferase [Azospirillum brasilense]MDW7629599.1 50S ribosomal protein L3 N(5)-glutamine methyltransferase [Azospirillum brasilense]MDX5954459.1 